MDRPVPNIYSIRREVPGVGHSVVIKEEADTLPQTDERIADAVPKYNFVKIPTHHTFNLSFIDMQRMSITEAETSWFACACHPRKMENNISFLLF